ARALGIGTQNFPEGAAVSLPLRQSGCSRTRAFVGGMLSGAVEPAGGILVVLAAAAGQTVMPWLLSFAAGAMLYVVVEELVPQAHSRAGTCGFVGGFLVMMVLDIALG
ncbi:MAG: ZIP family metal transporter, partial [Oscillospiraceae bacterium]|nr:ZIP family metal transporter [Oscillospiraceae bacterium]